MANKDRPNKGRQGISHFQSRFYKEYVVALRERHFYNANKKYDNHCDIKVGDVLLIKQDKIPRMCWKKGKVESLIIGRDGYVRGAVLRTHQKKLKGELPPEKSCRDFYEM